METKRVEVVDEAAPEEVGVGRGGGFSIGKGACCCDYGDGGGGVDGDEQGGSAGELEGLEKGVEGSSVVSGVLVV